MKQINFLYDFIHKNDFKTNTDKNNKKSKSGENLNSWDDVSLLV